MKIASLFAFAILSVGVARAQVPSGNLSMHYQCNKSADCFLSSEDNLSSPMNLAADGDKGKPDASFAPYTTTLITKDHSGHIVSSTTTESLHACRQAAGYIVSTARGLIFNHETDLGSLPTEAACINTDTVEIIYADTRDMK